MYVTQCLSPRSQHHTRRFSFENPKWSDEEDHLLGVSSQRFSWEDDEATIVNPSTRAQSRCSQNTLCGSMSLSQEYCSTSRRDGVDFSSFEQSPNIYYKDLPPTPSSDQLGSSPSPKVCLPSSGKYSIPESHRLYSDKKQETSTTGKVLPFAPSSIRSDRLHSWPTFVAQRKAPSPPLEEKSAWSDSGSDDEEEDKDQIARFKRRISSPLRSFLCKGKEPRRKSA